jgi:hypothetical protein
MGLRQVVFLRQVRGRSRLSDTLDIALKKVERFIIFVRFELGFYSIIPNYLSLNLLGTVAQIIAGMCIDSLPGFFLRTSLYFSFCLSCFLI